MSTSNEKNPLLDMPAVSGRDIAALQDPRPVCIVGAYDPNEQRSNFATIIWATPVSHDPAMVCFALRGASKTMQMIQQTRACSLCLLPANERGIELTEICGGSTGHQTDKAAQVPHTLVSMSGTELDCHETMPDGLPCGGCLPVPVMDESISWMTCQIEDIREVGDHLLATALVIAARSTEDRDDLGRIAPHNTLLCVQHGEYTTR